MPASLSIGDFSRATHLSIKTLRHYHERELLVPSEVDASSGYRRYTSEQIPAAQVIRRFRDLDMPLEQIRAVLDASDVRARNQLIAAHLTRLERDLAQTQSAVASLRDLLSGASQAAPVSQRRAPSALTAAVTSVIRTGELLPWFRGALGELQATLRASGLAPAGPPGGSYATELFSRERGEATVFIPVTTEITPVGRVAARVIPAAELAVIVHPGPHDDVDRSYGTLAAYVAEHALSVDGPIREYYLTGWLDTDDESAWRTEIGWPVFSTGLASTGLAHERPSSGVPRPEATCSSSIMRDASALDRSSRSTSRPASRASVCKYDRCGPVIGSSPVLQSAGSLAGFSCGLTLSAIIPPSLRPAPYPVHPESNIHFPADRETAPGVRRKP